MYSWLSGIAEPRRRGVALLITLVVLLLVEAMAAGMLALALQSRLVADARLRSTSADAVARFAVESVLRSWPEQHLEAMVEGVTTTPAGGQGTTSATSWSTTTERLAASTFLVRAEAHTGGANAVSTARLDAVVRMLDPPAVLHQLDAAVTSGGPLIAGGATRIAGGTGSLPPAWEDSLCPPVPYLPYPRALKSVEPPLIAPSVEIVGNIVVDSTVALDTTALGNLNWRDVAQIADTVASDAVALPVNDDTFPLIYGPADLTISGRGHAIVVAAGVLTIADSAHVVGVFAARSGLSVGKGTQVHGALLSRSGWAAIEDAIIEYSGCAVARALATTPAAKRPVLGERRFIPTF